MRLQRLLIPVMFALLLLLAYVVAAQTDENWPDPYRPQPLTVIEPDALVSADESADAPLFFISTARCEAP